MSVVGFIEATADRYSESVESVIFGYFPNVADPPEFQIAIDAAKSREVAWRYARASLFSLRSKRAPVLRVDMTRHTMYVGANGDGWHIFEVRQRAGRGAG